MKIQKLKNGTNVLANNDGHEFIGVVVGYRNGLCQVLDQDDNVFEIGQENIHEPKE